MCKQQTLIALLHTVCTSYAVASFSCSLIWVAITAHPIKTFIYFGTDFTPEAFPCAIDFYLSVNLPVAGSVPGPGIESWQWQSEMLDHYGAQYIHQATAYFYP